MGQGREAEGITSTATPLSKAGRLERPAPPHHSQGPGEGELSAPLGSQRVLGGSIKTLVFWVSDLRRNAAAPPGVLREVRPVGGAFMMGLGLLPEDASPLTELSSESSLPQERDRLSWGPVGKQRAGLLWAGRRAVGPEPGGLSRGLQPRLPSRGKAPRPLPTSMLPLWCQGRQGAPCPVIAALPRTRWAL